MIVNADKMKETQANAVIRQPGERISGLDLLKGGRMPPGYHKSEFNFDLSGACERIRKAAEEAAIEAGLIPPKQEYLGMFGELMKMPPQPKPVVNLGYDDGELCNRQGCQGKIQEMHPHNDGCSCHINPPCSYCVGTYHYCPACEWTDEEDHGS